MHPNRNFRWATASDYDELADIMFDAVRNGASQYTEEQRAAWVPARRAGDEWTGRLDRHRSWWGSRTGTWWVSPAWRTAAMSTSPTSGRERRSPGLFRQLLSRIIAEAAARGEPRLWTHASLMAEPAFATLGFKVTKREQVRIGDQLFDRCEMEMLLADREL